MFLRLCGYFEISFPCAAFQGCKLESKIGESRLYRVPQVMEEIPHSVGISRPKCRKSSR